MRPALDYITLKLRDWDKEKVINNDSYNQSCRLRLVKIIEEIQGITDNEDIMLKKGNIQQTDLQVMKSPKQELRSSLRIQSDLRPSSQQAAEAQRSVRFKADAGLINRTLSLEDIKDSDDLNTRSKNILIDDIKDDKLGGPEQDVEKGVEEAARTARKNEDDDSSNSDDSSDSDEEDSDEDSTDGSARDSGSSESEDSGDDDDDEEETIDLKVTIHHSNEVRGFSVPVSTGFETVMKQLQDYYDSAPKLCYRDDDGDKVAILASSDFQYAVRAHKALNSKMKKIQKLTLSAEFSRYGSSDLLNGPDSSNTNTNTRTPTTGTIVLTPNNDRLRKFSTESYGNIDQMIRERRFVCVDSGSPESSIFSPGGRMESSEVLWQRGELLGNQSSV